MRTEFIMKRLSIFEKQTSGARRLSIFEKQSSGARQRPIIATSLELSYSSESNESFTSTQGPKISRNIKTQTIPNSLPRDVESLQDVFDLIIRNRSRVLSPEDFKRAVSICTEAGQLLYAGGQYRSTRISKDKSNTRKVSHARYALGQLFLHGYGRYTCQRSDELCGLFCFSSNCLIEKYHGKRLFELSNVQGRHHFGSKMMLISIHAAEFVQFLTVLFNTGGPSDTRNYITSGCYRSDMTDEAKETFFQWFKRSVNVNSIACYIRGLVFKYDGKIGLSKHPYYQDMWSEVHGLEINEYDCDPKLFYSERDLSLCQDATTLLLTIHEQLCYDYCKSKSNKCSHSNAIRKITMLRGVLADINIC